MNLFKQVCQRRPTVHVEPMPEYDMGKALADSAKDLLAIASIVLLAISIAMWSFV